MRLSPFRLHRPTSLEDACELLRELGEDAQPYCGGTELLLVSKLGLTDFTDLVDLKGVPELAGIESDGGLWIGAATTHREIERSPVVREGWPALAAMERQVANIRVRNTGSIGGNLCFADPHSDPATFLIAAGGAVVASDGRSRREIPVEEFTQGPYATALESGELLVSVLVPRLPAGSVLVHRKMAFNERPAITVSVLVSGSEMRIAVGSVGVVAKRLPRAEERLASGGADACADIAAEEAEPVEDANGSVEYKRQLVRVLVGRCAREALDSAVPRRQASVDE